MSSPTRKEGQPVKHRMWIAGALLALLWATPAKADTGVIVRTTAGLSALQTFCALPTTCTVVGPLDGTLGQVFLVTTPLDPTTFIGLLSNPVGGLVGFVDAEVDQVLSLIGGLNVVPTPIPSMLMSDRTPVPYYGTDVWNSYANQPAASIVEIQNAQNTFHVSGTGIVADIDTGVDPTHPVLKPVLLPGYDFTRNQVGGSELNDLPPSFPPPPACSSASCPSPAKVNQSSAAILDQSSTAILDGSNQYAAFGHGTMVMGIIHLVAPTAQLLPLKAFHSDGTASLSDILRAIVYPAALQSDVMGVASTTNQDTRSSFSNYGNAIVWVAAPGESVVTTYPFDTYAAGWGTSFSAPFVSGGAALLRNLKSAIDEPGAAIAVAQAVPLTDPGMGHGRLDLCLALGSLAGASCSPDYGVSATPSTATITAGQQANFTVSATPQHGSKQTVTWNCTGAPAAATCTVSPSTVTLDGTNAATATVTLTTTARTMSPPLVLPRFAPPMLPRVVLAACFAGLVVLLMVCNVGRTFRQRPALAAAAGLLAVSLCAHSCTGTYSSGPPPGPGLPTLSSIAVNPTSVNGGSNSAGTVTLSASAPSGGVVVYLSSSASAATVPASVTVAAGATSATFTVSTSNVTASTSVTVTASYGGATQTASLTVMPAPSGGTPAGAYTLTVTGTSGNLSHNTTIQVTVN